MTTEGKSRNKIVLNAIVNKGKSNAFCVHTGRNRAEQTAQTRSLSAYKPSNISETVVR